jgi:hypothetical protein
MNPFYLLVNNEKEGPYSLEELRQKGVTENSLVWREGYDAWTPAWSVPELREILPSAANKAATAAPFAAEPVVLPPKTWFVEAFLVVIFCCSPFGIPGLIYAVQVEHMLQTKRYDLARLYSQKAKKWVTWGFFIGLGLLLLYILFWFLVVAANLSGFSQTQGYSDVVL